MGKRKPFIGNPNHIRFSNVAYQKIFDKTGIVMMSPSKINGNYYFITRDLKEYFTQDLSSIEMENTEFWNEYKNENVLPDEFGAKEVILRRTDNETVFQFFFNGMPRGDMMSDNLIEMISTAINKSLGNGYVFSGFTGMMIKGQPVTNVVKIKLNKVS